MKPRAKQRSPNRTPKSARPRKAGSPSGTATNTPRPRIGLEATYEAVVPHDWTIQAINPQLPPVLSTPRMIQMMEHAAAISVQPELPPGWISVGTRIEIDHLKAVPNGAAVRAHARLTGYKGRFLIFDVEALSGNIAIGRGKVFRAVVQSGSHGEKARARVSPPGSNPRP